MLDALIYKYTYVTTCRCLKVTHRFTIIVVKKMQGEKCAVHAGHKLTMSHAFADVHWWFFGYNSPEAFA